MSMVDVCYWELYTAFYGEDSDLGRALYTGQEQCIQYEKMGTLVSTYNIIKSKYIHSVSCLLISVLLTVIIANVSCICSIRSM